MPAANSIPVPANRIGPYPGHAPGATPKPKLLDCLREALRSRHSFATHLLQQTTPYVGDSCDEEKYREVLQKAAEEVLGNL